ncbi:DUF3052 domain-containing protein [Tabrizicola sp. J26]|uniref:DUF3052 domain-containing protein n=1 Tax=Alitabrizicola rongguiensis TaxID=2909234 RepID=UPI001F267E0B|nr:DUF3052 domain-containing protein [Tabrizicola rongguiensis]MCF1707219.1 DUF3052 domain-containing protein [Tabrizicola rongguiensis]
MGREAVVLATAGEDAGEVKAILESGELILRGAFRRRWPRAALAGVRVEDGVLALTAAGEPVRLDLGPMADRWAKALATPPTSLQAKLGLNRGKALVVGPVADSELAAALEGATAGSLEEAAMVVAVVTTDIDLATAQAALEGRRDRPLWVVYPKGRGVVFGDGEIRTALRAAGMMDTKACAVSERLTATRFGFGASKKNETVNGRSTTDERLMKWIDQINRGNGYAGQFNYPASNSDKQIVELSTISEWLRSMKSEFGKDFGRAEINPNDPPDFFVSTADIRLSVELVQLIDQKAKKRAEKGESQYSGQLFSDTQWSKERFRTKLDELIRLKGEKYQDRSVKVDVLLIYTAEPWLTSQMAQDWLSGLDIGTHPCIRSAYLLFEYDPASGKRHWPFFRIYGSTPTPSRPEQGT